MSFWKSKSHFHYKVYTDVDKNKYVTFDDLIEAKEYAKAHDTVVWVHLKEDYDSIMRYRGQTVKVFLTSISVLSVIGWGWILLLCEVGLI